MSRVRIIFILMFFLSCLTELWSVPVSIDFNYDVSLRNYYIIDGTVYTLFDDAVNADAEAFKIDYNENKPVYNGGSVFRYVDNTRGYGLAGLFIGYFSWPSTTENWSTNDIQGKLSIGTNSIYPQGSSVPVEVYYEGIEDFGPHNLYKGLVIFTGSVSNNVYWMTDNGKSTTTVNLIAGNEYDIIAYTNAGTSSSPFIDGLDSEMYFNFNAVPEPATILMLSLGIPILSGLRKRK